MLSILTDVYNHLREIFCRKHSYNREVVQVARVQHDVEVFNVLDNVVWVCSSLQKMRYGLDLLSERGRRKRGYEVRTLDRSVCIGDAVDSCCMLMWTVLRCIAWRAKVLG